MGRVAWRAPESPPSFWADPKELFIHTISLRYLFLQLSGFPLT